MFGREPKCALCAAIRMFMPKGIESRGRDTFILFSSSLVRANSSSRYAWAKSWFLLSSFHSGLSAVISRSCSLIRTNATWTSLVCSFVLTSYWACNVFWLIGKAPKPGRETCPFRRRSGFKGVSVPSLKDAALNWSNYEGCKFAPRVGSRVAVD